MHDIYTTENCWSIVDSSWWYNNCINYFANDISFHSGMIWYYVRISYRRLLCHCAWKLASPNLVLFCCLVLLCDILCVCLVYINISYFSFITWYLQFITITCTNTTSHHITQHHITYCLQGILAGFSLSTVYLVAQVR